MSISITWPLGPAGLPLPPPQPSVIAANDKAARRAARPVRQLVMARTLAESGGISRASPGIGVASSVAPDRRAERSGRAGEEREGRGNHQQGDADAGPVERTGDTTCPIDDQGISKAKGHQDGEDVAKVFVKLVGD